MVTGVGGSSYGAQWPTSGSSGDGSIAALKGRIQQKQVQLNDWVTCVSAKTPKGREEIQKLSGEINGDKAQIARAQQAQSSGSSASASLARSSSDSQRGALVDVWA